MDPIAEKSSANNSRWTAMFLKRHGFSLPDGELPAVPVHSQLLTEFLSRRPEYMHYSTFELIRRQVRINLNPPARIRAISDAIKERADILNSSAGKHWLSLWCNTADNVLRLGVRQATQLLRDTSWACRIQVPDGLTVKA